MIPRFPPPVEIQAISEMYRSGLTFAEITARTGRAFNTIRNVLTENGVTIRPWHKVKPHDIETIITRYVAGESAPMIAPDYGVIPNRITQILRERGLTRTHKQARPPLPCDSSYFNVIDTEPKAYWLGFIAADGSVYASNSGYRFGMALNEVDRAHLETFRSDVASTGAITHNAKTRSYHLSLRNDEMMTALISHGIVPRKSLVLTFPTTVPHDLMRHYIRGYFDGDGSIFTSGTHTVVSWVGNRDFLTSLREHLNRDAFDTSVVGAGTLVSNRLHHPLIASLRYGKRAAIAIHPYFYDGATRFLQRKHARFVNLLATHVQHHTTASLF